MATHYFLGRSIFQLFRRRGEKSLTAHIANYIQIECKSIWLTDLCFLLFYFQPDKSMDDGYFKVKLKKMSPDVPDLKQFFDVPQWLAHRHSVIMVTPDWMASDVFLVVLPWVATAFTMVLPHWLATKVKLHICEWPAELWLLPESTHDDMYSICQEHAPFCALYCCANLCACVCRISGYF